MKIPLIAFVALLLTGSLHAAEFSITMDDFSLSDSTKFSAQERNESVLKTLAKYKVKAALFVVCKFIQNDIGRQLLSEWGRAGHLIGNHTYSHPRYGSSISYETFSDEASRCHETLKSYPGFQPLFRFPTLAEGDTIEKRDKMREWLKSHGYKNGHVSIDASDWYVDQRMRDKIRQDSEFDLTKYRAYYLKHVWERAQYYDQLSKKVIGREVKHTLLVHFNLLNALFLDDLIAMFQSRGWKLIDADAAFADPLYSQEPQSMPSGQSIIWGLAKASGKHHQLRYPGEDGEYEKSAMDKLGL